MNAPKPRVTFRVSRPMSPGMPRSLPHPRLPLFLAALLLASLALPSRAAPGPASGPAPAPAPGAPAYDLPADREARIREARASLGPRTEASTVSDVFVLLGAGEWRGPAFQRSVSLVQSAMDAFLNGRFAKKPDHAISVYLFANAASYEAFCKSTYGAPCIAHYGFYEPGKRFMVMNAGLGLGTLTHELVHPLVEADFPGAPTWLNEGIASVFEAPVIPKAGEIHGAKNWRHPRLLRALDGPEKATTRLETLFAMSDTTFRGDGEDLHYAMARYTCQWLDQRGRLWAFYQRWRDDAANDPTGEKAFAHVTGQTPGEATGAWSKWVRAL